MSNRNNIIFFYFLLSLVIAIFLTFSMYPGILMTDSNARWYLAEQILSVFKNKGFQQLNSWLSPTPSIFFAIILLFTKNIAVFTFIQSLLFYFSCLCIIEKICKSKAIKILAILFIIFMPPFWGFSVYHDMSVWIVIVVNIFYLLIEVYSKKYSNFNNIKRLFYYIGIFLCLYFAFGFRQNALTIFPIVLYQIYIVSNRLDLKKLRKVLFFVVLLSLISVQLLPKFIGIHTGGSQSAGFVWEILTTIQSLPESKKDKYIDYLDYINGDGSTKRSLDLNIQTPERAGEWLFRGDSFPLLSIGRKEISSKIIKSYLNMYLKEPKAMLKNKVYFILRTLGIRDKLVFDGYYENDVNDYSKYGLSEYNIYRSKMIKIVNTFINKTLLFLIPWVWFLISFLGVFLSKQNKYDSLLWLLYSIFYFGAFFINTQGFLYRYFFTANCFLFFSIISSFSNIFNDYTKMTSFFKVFFNKTIYIFNKKIFLIFLFFIIIILLFIGSNSVWLDNYRMIKNIKKYGVNIYKDSDISVWYSNNEAIFIKNIDSDQSGYYYIRVYYDKEKFDTIDFYLIYNEIHTIFYDNKRIAYVKLPDKKLYKVVVGHTGMIDPSLKWEEEYIIK